MCRLKITSYISEIGRSQSVDRLIIFIIYHAAVTKR